MRGNTKRGGRFRFWSSIFRFGQLRTPPLHAAYCTQGKTSLGFTNSGSKLIERINEYFSAERNVLAVSDKIVHRQSITFFTLISSELFVSVFTLKVLKICFFGLTATYSCQTLQTQGVT